MTIYSWKLDEPLGRVVLSGSTLPILLSNPKNQRKAIATTKTAAGIFQLPSVPVMSGASTGGHNI
jgi:hypothetical protein